EIRPGRSSYVGFVHNGVTSRSTGAWAGSLVLAGAAPMPRSHRGGGSGPTTTTTPSGSGPIPPPTGTATGTVLVGGRSFTSGTIPFNVTVDVTDGTLQMTATTGTLKVFGADNVTAAFRLARGKDGKTPLIEIRLVKGDF